MINTFIAMTTYGQIFFSKIFQEDSQADISLTAGLISAVYQMTSETEGQKIENLDLENVRTLFRETEGDKLFIITLDKQMDDADANDLLDDIIERFQNKYGDVQVDGLILSDFETDVIEAVNHHIWHDKISHHPKWYDIFPMLILAFCAYWYPMHLIDYNNRLILPILNALQQGVIAFILELLYTAALLIMPILTLTITLKFFPNTKKMIRFIVDILVRPTRSGYSEKLPYYFLFIPIVTALMLYSVVRWGRGMYYSLFSQTIGRGVEAATVWEGTDETSLWFGINIFIFLYLLTWYALIPVIIGGITQNFSWNYFKGNVIVISIALIFLLPASFFSGINYQVYMGFHPESETLYPREIISLDYILLVTIPTYFSVLSFVFYFVIGTNRLIKKNRPRYPIALSVAFLSTLALQKLIFWYFFESGLWIYSRPVFLG
jgi:hypothetical protein